MTLQTPGAGEANKNGPDYFYSMGEKYEFGDKVPRDLLRAKTWYKKAAALGHPLAQDKLNSPFLNGEIKPIKSAPSLFTINGCGFKLYGKSGFDHQSGSYMTTHFLTLVYFPLLPLARYRVISDDGYNFIFLGKGKFRAFEWMYAGIFVALLVGLYFSKKI